MKNSHDGMTESHGTVYDNTTSRSLPDVCKVCAWHAYKLHM